MKKMQYESPEVKILSVNASDILTTSGNENELEADVNR